MSGTREAPDDGAAGAISDGVASGGQNEEAAEAGGAAAQNSRDRRTERRLVSALSALRERDAELAQLRSRLSEANEAGNRAAVAAIDAEITQAKRSLQDAHSAGDPEQVVSATDRLTQAAAARAIASVTSARKPAEGVAGGQAPQRFTPRTQEWLDANPWYGTDPDLTAIAQVASRKALADGLKADTDEYWARVAETVERLEPGVVQEPEGFARRRASAAAASGRPAPDEEDGQGAQAPAPSPRRPGLAPGGAPVTRNGSVTRPAQREVLATLTSAQEEAAKIAGVSNQEYAARLRARIKSGQIPAGGR